MYSLLRVSLYPNRLSSTTGGNREIDQLYMTSRVSNMQGKRNFLKLVDKFSKIKKSGKTENKEYIKLQYFIVTALY